MVTALGKGTIRIRSLLPGRSLIAAILRWAFDSLYIMECPITEYHEGHADVRESRTREILQSLRRSTNHRLSLRQARGASSSSTPSRTTASSRASSTTSSSSRSTATANANISPTRSSSSAQATSWTNSTSGFGGVIQIAIR
ncbi:hypothetical protein POJ06DRAFT_239478 [Lipomyces tetrasporus]|uniref:Uncharacterized protein n=1 Tax=Lipomyces tetrasporus TaxID=54092 RepID=A0AAD7VQ69_9ASCO|nr:uncharacterized protein POJ06DRAFT_239478 [Lipomyces tetrasporus]KAJ8098587.1 hypothetical protein POJ06DRAFT_239478 [Lipomyces tetrasporus]